MLAVKAEIPPMTEAQHRATFFRQSGWLMFATIFGGFLMWAVHPLAKKTGPIEYGAFGVYLAIAMCVPTMPLQMVLTQQTAKALATGRERELSGMIRLVWLGTFVLWLIGALAVWFLQAPILKGWHLANATGLWVTVPTVLLTLWLPIFWGVLQGQQNFLWLGWSTMVNGFGRLGIAAFAVLVLGGYAAGMMTGVLLGLLAGLGIAVWQTRSVWLAPPEPFDWRGLLRQAIPLMFGFAAFQFQFTADNMFVKSYFPDDAGFYNSAGTLSRALMWLVGPLAAVMFPRIVHSAAKAEKTDLMGVVLVGTAVLAIGGVVGLSLLGPFLVRIIYDESWVRVASSVLPWYAGAMVPLALANVLLNNLLARSAFKVVPAVCVLAMAYAFALTRFHDSLVMVLQTLGVFNLLLLIVCAWFTWGVKAEGSKS